ncbi:Ig-like domain repeat protein [Occallatibacter savannae]|uniref:Ig-like domain repeat protein n=1 Tax=Occallatibacter savannae TaxID=1002691 RepID=UPI000D68C18B|nr:Ig-like domain repeat protein [Occallatibacter savannae]
MRSLRLLALVCLTTLSLAGIRTHSQSASSRSRANRITEKIDDERLLPLSGNTLPVANAGNDLGRVRGDLAMTDLVLVLSRGPEQQAAFDALVASQYDPTSASFHRWLEPNEVGEKFGPSTADIATIATWLTHHGLTVAEISKDRMSIRFSGNASQVQAAFHTDIHNLQVNGQRHIANMRDPQIPIALAPVVAGVKALHDFRPHPLHSLGSKAKLDASTGKWSRLPADPTLSIAAKTSAIVPHPDFGITVSTSGGAYPIEDVTPYDFATIYNVFPLWNAGTDGTGQTIAIAGTSDINPQDVANYRSAFGLPAGPPVNTIVANGVDPGQCTAYAGLCTLGDLFENTLDVEVSGAVAKNAQIDLVVSGTTSPTTDTVFSSANYVIQNNTAKILSVSYGLCELFMGTSGNAAYNNLWETGAAEGISIFVATGDAAAPTCDQNLATSVPYGARFGLSVNGLASSPYVTAVGGTDFAWCKPSINSSGQEVGCSSTSPWWNATNSASTGASAANYVPEVPWNDTCASSPGAAYLESLAKYLGYAGVTDPETACNFVVNNYSSIYQRYGINLSFFVNSVGGGGGASTCTTSNTSGTTTTPDPSSCSGGYAKPSWQSGISGMPSDGKRDLPDLSFFAGNGLWNSATLVCVSATGSCVTGTTTSGEPVSQEVGGTSVASPQMAGVMALINQKAGVNQGSPNPELYALAAKQSWTACTAESVKTSSACYFNDVDSSTISSPCQAGSRDCTVTHTGDTWGLLSGFSAGRAYDQATGLGSLNVANVVNGWTSLLGTTPASITLTPAQNTLVLDQPLQVAITVAGSSGTPSGNVTIVGGGYDGGAQTLASGAYTFTIPPFSLAAGSYKLTGSYQGDSTYAQASATASITVNKITPTVSVTLNPTSIGANTPITANITVAGAATDPKPTGTVQLSGGGYTSSACTLSSGACSITIPSNSLSNGNITITATYAGDTNYQTATATATETVNALKPAVTITPAVSSPDTVTPLPITITVTGSGPTPTGSIGLAGALGGTLGNGLQLTCTLSGGSCSITMLAGYLYGGADTLTAAYSGDTTYLPQTATTVVTVNKANPVFDVTPSSASIFTNNALTLTGSIASPVQQPVGAPWVTPTGSISVTGGGYSGSFGGVGPWTLDSPYTFIIPAGSLAAGTDMITLTYSGDRFFNAATTSTTLVVNQWTKVASTLSLTPASPSSNTGQLLNVTAVVTGGNGPATGTVTLTSGTYNSGPWPVFAGTVTIPIYPNSLTAGDDTINATYSGDPTYLSSTAALPITVTASTFSIAAQPPAPSIKAGQSAVVNIGVNTTTGYTGTVSFTCALTTHPTSAINLPSCTQGISAYLDNSHITTIGEVQITTTATNAFLTRPVFPGFGAVSGAAFATFVFWFLPVRRRSSRAFLGLTVVLFVFAGLNACGGGGGSNTTGSTGNSGSGGGTNATGTTPGVYTFTVTATGNPAVSPAPTTTFNVTVN